LGSTVLHADGSGFQNLQTFLFQLPSEQLTQNVHDYLRQADYVLKEFESEKAQMSENALTQLQAVRSRIQNLMKVFGGSQKYGPDHDQWKMISPYSPYFDFLFGKMRQEFKQRGCLVPSTYSTSYELSITKLFALPIENPDADLVTLRNQSEQLT